MHETAQDYGLAFEHNPLPMWVVECETMGFLAVNNAALRQYGYSRSEWLALKLPDIRRPEDLVHFRERWQTYLSQRSMGKSVSLGQLTHRRKNGSLLTVDVSASPIVFEGREAILSVAVDVSDRVQAEREARAATEHFDLVLRVVTDTIWDWNLLTDEVWRSQNTMSAYGTPSEDLAPHISAWRDRLHPDDLARVMGGLHSAWKAGARTWSGEYRIRRPDGSWADILDRAQVFYDPEGRAVRMLGSMVDITERKRIDQALLDQRRRLKAIFDNAQDGIFLTNDDGRFLDANPAALAMFGYSLEELRALTMWDLILKELREEYRERVRTLLRTGSEQGEGRGVRKDGAVIELEYRTVANIEPGIHLAVMRDITQRKRSEESLRNLSGRLLRLQDEERRRLARELHDSTGQCLAALALTLAIVQEERGRLTTRGRRALEETHAQAEQCSRELRTISYLLHPPLLDELGLATALRGYVEGFAKRSGIEIRLEIPPDLARLPREVETTLFRIVQECLTNVHRHTSSPIAAVSLTYDTDDIRIEVADRGKGLEGALENGGAPDLGVGIAGMKERVRQLGGTLEFESTARGLTVRAVMPRMQR